jgi:hypothetical protein
MQPCAIPLQPHDGRSHRPNGVSVSSTDGRDRTARRGDSLTAQARRRQRRGLLGTRSQAAARAHPGRTPGVQAASSALTTPHSNATYPSQSSGRWRWHEPPTAAISRRTPWPLEFTSGVHAWPHSVGPETPAVGIRVCGRLSTGRVHTNQVGIGQSSMSRPESSGRGRQTRIGRPLVYACWGRAACEYRSRRHGRDVCRTGA